MDSLLPRQLSLIRQFIGRFPGIGERSAHRILVYLLSVPEEDLLGFGKLVSELPGSVEYCPVCYFFSRNGQCPFCGDSSRDHNSICVVEQFSDVLGLESTGEYRGCYHILGGVISPLAGIGPENLNLDSLLERVSGSTKELILALNPETEGEITMQFIGNAARQNNPTISISRLAFGLPVGASLEYCDPRTIKEALRNRKTV